MTFKTGDLCVIVSGRNKELYGRIVTLTERYDWESWRTVERLMIWGGSLKILGVRDVTMKLICDPGDDAVDETLLRLPSPRQEVTA